MSILFEETFNLFITFQVSCRDITNGQQQCVAFDGCHVTSMKGTVLHTTSHVIVTSNCNVGKILLHSYLHKGINQHE